jgi:hypothetical protein
MQQKYDCPEISCYHGHYLATWQHSWLHKDITKSPNVIHKKRWSEPATWCLYIITFLLFFIEMIQYDWLWSGHMIIKEMFHICNRNMTVPKYPAIMDTTWPLGNTVGYFKFCITNHLKSKIQSVCIVLIKDKNCNTVCTSPEGVFFSSGKKTHIAAFNFSQ